LDGTVRVWPLEGEVPLPGRVLLEDRGNHMLDLATTPDGEQILVGTDFTGVRLVSLFGEESRNVPDIERGSSVYGATISPDGQLGGGTVDMSTPETRILVWNLSSGQAVTSLRPEGRWVFGLRFTDDGHLLSSSEYGLRRWNLETGEYDVLYEGMIQDFAAAEDGKRAVIIEGDRFEASAPKRAVYLDLESGERTPLEAHGTLIYAVALDPKSSVVVTGDTEGVVRVGPVTGQEPHLLLGHESMVWSLAFDPLGRWIASGDNDGVIRLWPMPDLSKPPLHTLPRDELIAKLKTLTNLRVVRDEESATGWKLTHDPFPGWETVPTW
jgi:WD40 repeat protein